MDVRRGIGSPPRRAAPLAWSMLRDYQKARLYTFLSPDRDPLGAGYHILQSKIALGSGGLFGKGFLLGTQSHLSFLPEKQTDFIFTMIAEEFGLVGGLCALDALRPGRSPTALRSRYAAAASSGDCSALESPPTSFCTCSSIRRW